MSIEEKYEQYESYLDGSMSAEERDLFEQSLTNVEFKKEFDEYRHINRSFARMLQLEEKEKDFISNLKNIAKNYSNETDNQFHISNENKKPTSFNVTKNIKWILSAAAVLILGFFSYQHFFSPKQSMHDLYASNYSPEGLSVERGDQNDSLEKIVTLYNAKNYAEAYSLLTPYSLTHTDQTNLKLAMAICLIETNQYPVAEEKLQSIISANDVSKEKAQWYLAMLYLKEENKEKCITLLHTFESNHFYYSNAEKILKQLE